jgi:hypothetical protein
MPLWQKAKEKEPMATRQFQMNGYELMTLLSNKAALIVSHLNNCGGPQGVLIDDLGDELKRMVDLHLALKEAAAAMPRPTHSAQEGKRAS